MRLLNFLKNLGIRIIYFIIGVAATIFGAFAIYYDFKDFGSDLRDHHAWSYWIFLIGLVGILVAFAKKKGLEEIHSDKPVEDPPDTDQKTGP